MLHAENFKPASEKRSWGKFHTFEPLADHPILGPVQMELAKKGILSHIVDEILNDKRYEQKPRQRIIIPFTEHAIMNTLRSLKIAKKINKILQASRLRSPSSLPSLQTEREQRAKFEEIFRTHLNALYQFSKGEFETRRLDYRLLRPDIIEPIGDKGGGLRTRADVHIFPDQLERWFEEKYPNYIMNHTFEDSEHSQNVNEMPHCVSITLEDVGLERANRHRTKVRKGRADVEQSLTYFLKHKPGES